jgi:hypothetical protein
MPTTPHFKFRLVNRPNMGPYVDMESFTAVSRAWSEILESVSTERLNPKDKRSFRWVVTDLAIGSASLGIEPRDVLESDDVAPLPDDFWHDVSEFLAQGLVQVENGLAPEDVFQDVLADQVYLLVSTLGTDGVESIEFDFDGDTIKLTRDGAGRHQLQKLRQRSVGSVTGVLTSVSFSNRRPVFGLRPPGGRVIQCRFNAEQQTLAVTQALQRRVNVYGRIVRDDDGHIVLIAEVWEIEVLPDDASLMDLDQMFGADPDLTDDLSSTEWVRMIRGR